MSGVSPKRCLEQLNVVVVLGAKRHIPPRLAPAMTPPLAPFASKWPAGQPQPMGRMLCKIYILSESTRPFYQLVRRTFPMAGLLSNRWRCEAPDTGSAASAAMVRAHTRGNNCASAMLQSSLAASPASAASSFHPIETGGPQGLQLREARRLLRHPAMHLTQP